MILQDLCQDLGKIMTGSWLRSWQDLTGILAYKRLSYRLQGPTSNGNECWCVYSYIHVVLLNLFFYKMLAIDPKVSSITNVSPIDPTSVCVYTDMLMLFCPINSFVKC